MVLVVGLLAVTASAYNCSYCGKSDTSLQGRGDIETYSSVRVEGCGNKSGTHIHIYRRTPLYYKCNICYKDFTVYKYHGEMCP